MVAAMIEPLLTSEDVCTVLNISPSTFGRLVRSKKLIAVRVSPGKWGVQKSALQHYIESQSTVSPKKLKVVGG
jgi:excisionase family DNA binding protein